MVSNDYTKEVGLESGQKKISKPVAAILLAVLVGGAWYTIQTYAVPTRHRASEPLSKTAER